MQILLESLLLYTNFRSAALIQIVLMPALNFLVYPHIYSNISIETINVYLTLLLTFGNIAAFLLVESIIFFIGDLMAENRIKTEE